MDGAVKLFHLGGKRVLQTFVHCSPQAIEGAPAPASEDAMQEGDEDYKAEEGGMQKEESILSVECVGIAKGTLRWLASGGMDKTLKIWDTTNGSCRSVCTHGGGVVSLRWHSSLPVVCTGCLDNLVRLWDARSGSLLSTLTGHRDQVTFIDMITLPSQAGSDNEALDSIISASNDGTARVFQVFTSSLLR